MGLSMRVNGTVRTVKMEKVFKSGSMDLFTKDIGIMTKLMVEDD
jgi:hypothetical protein